MTSYNRRYRAGCIIFDTNGHILCVYNKQSQYWGFPKGSVKGVETPAECALRELREETGVTLTLEETNDMFSCSKGFFFVMIMPVRPRTRVRGPEIGSIKWMKIEDLRKQKMSLLTRGFLHRVELYFTKNATNIKSSLSPPPSKYIPPHRRTAPA